VKAAVAAAVAEAMAAAAVAVATVAAAVEIAAAADATGNPVLLKKRKAALRSRLSVMWDPGSPTVKSWQPCATEPQAVESVVHLGYRHIRDRPP
jgi:hypothetical protein